MMTLAKSLVFIGLILLVLGGLFYLLAKSGVNFNRIPGNLKFEWGNFTCVFALGMSILLSLILTFILNVIVRMQK
jgi:Protein of unknown function (DUF2905)